MRTGWVGTRLNFQRKKTRGIYTLGLAHPNAISVVACFGLSACGLQAPLDSDLSSLSD